MIIVPIVGCMLGFEFVDDEDVGKFLVIDLLILRFLIDL